MNDLKRRGTVVPLDPVSFPGQSLLRPQLRENIMKKELSALQGL